MKVVPLGVSEKDLILKDLGRKLELGGVFFCL